MFRIALIVAFTLFISQAFVFSEKKPALAAAGNPPKELGKVDWLRNFDQGLQKAAKSKKPIFLLFQEVPGCATCRNYGQNVLSHPLIVDAIETYFIPVAIFNNEGGEDKKVLDYYKEPSWNNPVVRIVNSKKQNIIPRVNRNYSFQGITDAIIQALEVSNTPIPKYLSLLEEELQAKQKGTETAVFSMYCFWTGEKKLGNIDGVVSTAPGFMNGREVVKVDFDTEKIRFDELVDKARQLSCADHVFTANQEQKILAEGIVGELKVADKNKFRLDKEPKYYLSKTAYRFIPMTALQAVRVNSRIGQSKSPDQYLSPSQLALLREVRANTSKRWKNVINEGILSGWEKVEAIRKK